MVLETVVVGEAQELAEEGEAVEAVEYQIIEVIEKEVKPANAVVALGKYLFNMSSCFSNCHLSNSYGGKCGIWHTINP